MTTEDYSAMIKDMIRSDSSLTDGLRDDEAEPLLRWAMRQAEIVGSQAVDEDDAYEKEDHLLSLIAKIRRFTLRRRGKDDSWLEEQLNAMDKHLTGLGGEPPPTSQRHILHDAPSMDNLEVIEHLTRVYSVGQDVPAAPEPPPAPPSGGTEPPEAMYAMFEPRQGLDLDEANPGKASGLDDNEDLHGILTRDVMNALRNIVRSTSRETTDETEPDIDEEGEGDA